MSNSNEVSQGVVIGLLFWYGGPIVLGILALIGAVGIGGILELVWLLVAPVLYFGVVFCLPIYGIYLIFKGIAWLWNRFVERY